MIADHRRTRWNPSIFHFVADSVVVVLGLWTAAWHVNFVFCKRCLNRCFMLSGHRTRMLELRRGDYSSLPTSMHKMGTVKTIRSLLWYIGSVWHYSVVGSVPPRRSSRQLWR
jgi:hypothetical protein